MLPKEHGTSVPIPGEDRPGVRYESYLLRLRRVTGPTGERCQVCLHSIRDDEEQYFAGLHELTTYPRHQCDGEREDDDT